MAQAQWQQVSPNFSRGITTAMSNAQQGIADVGKVAGDYLLRQDKLAQEETRKTERKQDVDFRQAQADQTQNNFLKSYALQGLSETRAAEEQAQKMATAEAQAKSSEYLNAARQNVVTPEQALKYSKTYDDMILKGRSAKEASAAMESLLKQDVQRYDASPVMQKQFIGNVNIDQGPMERSVKTIDPATGTVVDKVLQVNPDMKEAQTRKDMILSGLDKTIADDKRLQAEWDMLKTKEAGENKRQAARSKEAKILAEHTKAYTMMDPKTGNTTVAYGPTERDSMMRKGFQLGESPSKDKDKKDSYSSPYSSAEEKDWIDRIGSSDAAILKKAASSIAARFDIPADRAKRLAEQGVEYTWGGDNSVNLNKVKEAIIRENYPNYGSMSKSDKEAVSKVIASTLNEEAWD